MRRLTARPLSDSVVVITGGARGIGASTAEVFAAQRSSVWIGDLDADVAQETAAGLPGVRSAGLDVRDRESWQTFVDEVIRESGRIDVLVNNAGVMPLGPFLDEADDVIDLTLDVNVRGVINGMRAVAPEMIRGGGGRIVNVASMAGRLPIPGMVAYNASKFAARGVSLAARRELIEQGVVVSTVLPSAVRTELSSGAPLGHGMPTVDPVEVAKAVVGASLSGAREVSVPRWLGPGWSLVDGLVPEWLESRARRLIGDNRALTSLDADARRAYTDRIARHAGSADVASRGGNR